MLQIPSMPPYIWFCMFAVGLTLSYSPSQQQSISVTFDSRMKHLKTMHAKVLAIWAGTNMAGSGVLIFSTEASYFYFHAMNISWGLVNVGVAAFIYYHHNNVFRRPQSLLQQMDHQRHAEKMILFNIGLDHAFVATGMALYQHGQVLNINYADLWNGFGISVMMQGAFLLLQDTTFYQLHIKSRRRIYPLWQQLMEKLQCAISDSQTNDRECVKSSK
ncbi:MAG: hypothetical protein RIG62_28385 [Cyclobacteriaceae bacterium]